MIEKSRAVVLVEGISDKVALEALVGCKVKWNVPDSPGFSGKISTN